VVVFGYVRLVSQYDFGVEYIYVGGIVTLIGLKVPGYGRSVLGGCMGNGGFVTTGTPFNFGSTIGVCLVDGPLVGLTFNEELIVGTVLKEGLLVGYIVVGGNRGRVGAFGGGKYVVCGTEMLEIGKVSTGTIGGLLIGGNVGKTVEIAVNGGYVMFEIAGGPNGTLGNTGAIVYGVRVLFGFGSIGIAGIAGLGVIVGITVSGLSVVKIVKGLYVDGAGK